MYKWSRHTVAWLVFGLSLSLLSLGAAACGDDNEPADKGSEDSAQTAGGKGGKNSAAGKATAGGQAGAAKGAAGGAGAKAGAGAGGKAAAAGSKAAAGKGGSGGKTSSGDAKAGTGGKAGAGKGRAGGEAGSELAGAGAGGEGGAGGAGAGDEAGNGGMSSTDEQDAGAPPDQGGAGGTSATSGFASVDECVTVTRSNANFKTRPDPNVNDGFYWSTEECIRCICEKKPSVLASCNGIPECWQLAVCYSDNCPEMYVCAEEGQPCAKYLALGEDPAWLVQEQVDNACREPCGVDKYYEDLYR